MTAATSPLVTAYLADLERRLAGASPADRLDVLDAVHEHLDTALAELGDAPSADDVRRVLADLGRPDDVAGALGLGDAPGTTHVAPLEERTSPVVWVLLVLAGIACGLLVTPVVILLGTVHLGVLLGGLALIVGGTGWVGRRAHGRRAPRPRRPWQLAFAVVLPAAVVAGNALLAAGLFLPSDAMTVESEVVTTRVGP